MNKVLRFVLTAVLSTAIICQCALAGPAFPGPYSVDNGNGKTVQIMRYGNQDFVIETDMSGNLVTRDEEGKLRYIVTDDKEGYALSYVVSDTNSRVVSDEAVNRSTSDSDTWSGAISFLKGDNGIATFAEENTFICPPQTENDPLYGKFKDIGKIKKSERGESIPLLVVLVDFNDIKTKRGAKGWSDAIFAAGGLKNYYIENSTGEFSFEPAVFDGQDAPGVVEVTLPIDRPLYATQPDAMNGHVNTGIYKGTDGRDYRLLNDASFYAYAVNAVNEKYSIDFSEYDKNGDGYIDENELCVETIMAGYEASSMGDPEGAPAMWMKRWNIYCGDNGDGTLDYGDFDMVVLDGVGLSPFITCGEVLYLDPEQFGGQKGDILYNQIGGFAHELGHILGANDLYDVTYALANRMNAGYMSIMSGGSWGYNEESPIPGEAPTSLDPLNKFMMGFCEPTEVTTGGAFKLYPSSSRDYNFLEIDTNDPDISYLIENRQFTSFDKSLHDMYESYKNGGISVWRLNNKVAKREWNDNRVNSVAEDYGFIPVFADGVVSRRPFWNTEALDAGNFDNTALPSVGYPSAETHYNMVLQESDPLIALCVDKNTDSDGSVTFQVIMSDATEKPVLEGSGVFIKYDDIYKSADFQLENGGYTENAVWKIYSDVRNSTEAEGITAEYDAQTDKLILKSDTDIPVGEYWASVTEIGLEESLLVKLTVKEAAYELCAEPESLDFGAKYTGYTPKEKTVVLKNTGGLPVENLSASSSSAAFEMTIDKDKLLNYGDTCTLSLQGGLMREHIMKISE